MTRKGQGYSVIASVLLLLLLSMSSRIECSNQVHALSRLYLSKRGVGSSTMDTSHFKVVKDLKPSSLPSVSNHEKLRKRDLIRRLPGQPPVDFDQYGGYVTVNESAGRSFFYYFVEASKSKDSSPLLLWLNGGPGCSSLAYGALQELGPFRVHSDGKTLFRNRYAWNNAANVLFLESPAGVGFSYTNTTSDMEKHGDRNTAADNYIFLVKWLERFPAYKGRDLYIAGESYAGHYVPQLAHTILLHHRSFLNLKGILIGNAVINDETDLMGMYDFFESHALISEDSLATLKNSCDLKTESASVMTEECAVVSDQIDMDTYYLDIYNIYAPLCLNSTLTRRPKRGTTIREFDPCSDHYVQAYLNRPEVQAALHANATKLPYEWQPCSSVIKKWNDSPTTMIPLIKGLMGQGVRVWVFSGDMDGRIPVTSTKYSLKKMNLTAKTAWHPWYLGGEVGGYTEEYKEKLTFATVRGAGHQVPSFQPKRSLSLFIHFLNDTPLPDTSRY
ncbi:PREDICTED: serine carboxypeptidase-like 40 [Camelina sativa]|uniref:Carboxypeptidase n=1 Tax=Camelina sativa TaxID=90675 RepID=A0ABM0WBV7_CAMSA|nr:PREDICTED: serine carboxypeptidase-like 40 [Camelina sativa]